MAGTVRDRVIALRAVLARTTEMRPVSVLAGVGFAVQWYGLQRRALRRRMRVSPLDARFDWVEVDGYALAWPVGAPLYPLESDVLQLDAPTNGHYYYGLAAVVPGDHVLDVGACEGTFALDALRRGAARAYCLEPYPLMADALRLTARRNGLGDRLLVREVAVSDANGTVDFLTNPDNPTTGLLSAHVTGGESPDAETRRVESCSLDAWVEREGIGRLDFVKIDAEGADAAIIRGGRETLRRLRPDVAVTTYHASDHCREISAELRALGYRLRVRGCAVFDGVARPMMVQASVRR